MSDRRRWPDLPPELLTVVSGRLHMAADYVRFHAVCKPWRESLPPSMALRPTFFPWLVAPPCGPNLKLRCVFSKKSYRAVAPGSFSRHSWVTSADGTAAWYFTASHGPKLVDPLTGDTRTLPPFLDDDDKAKWGMENSRGVVYGDGTVFLYNFSEPDLDEDDSYDIKTAWLESLPFRAAILPPGDTTWKFMYRTFDIEMVEEEEFPNNHFFATYRVYDGMTLVRLDGDDYDDTISLEKANGAPDTWQLLPPPVVVHPSIGSQTAWKLLGLEDVTEDWRLESSHVLESRGELLRVSVLIQRDEFESFISQRAVYEVTVEVHALEEEVDADGRHTVRWVGRDGQGFSDRVMFLGFPASFAVEASRFRGGEDVVTGGCVYFHQRRLDVYGRRRLRNVFRYNLVNGKTKFLGRLPPAWNGRKNQAFMWLLPQPSIAPFQVIRERLQSQEIDHRTERISTIIQEPPEYFKGRFFSFVVRNLPSVVDSSRLRRFFSKHGKVFAAEVTSAGKGRVTMAMMTSYEHSYEAEDALDGLVLDGHTLGVGEATMTTRELCVAASRRAVTFTT